MSADFSRLVALARSHGVEADDLQDSIEEVAENLARIARSSPKNAIGFLLGNGETPEAVELAIVEAALDKDYREDLVQRSRELYQIVEAQRAGEEADFGGELREGASQGPTYVCYGHNCGTDPACGGRPGSAVLPPRRAAAGTAAQAGHGMVPEVPGAMRAQEPAPGEGEPMSAIPDFYLPVKHGETFKYNDVSDRARTVRLYCTMRRAWWSLQLRGPLRRADGREDKDFIVASASLDKEGLLALRAAIDEQLATCRDEPEPAEVQAAERERIFAAIALTAPIRSDGKRDLCLYRGCANSLFPEFDHTEGCPWRGFRELPEVRAAVEAERERGFAQEVQEAERKRLQNERSETSTIGRIAKRVCSRCNFWYFGTKAGGENASTCPQGGDHDYRPNPL